MRRQGMRRPARTLLEQLIRERQQTLEEFVEYAENFARSNGETGTLSVRHLQRLVAGRLAPEAPLGPLRPATARLLERVFRTNIDELLAPFNPSGETEAHLLRVAIAVVIDSSSVLVVCRRAPVEIGSSWQFPAGIVKPGAWPEIVAVEETFAETDVRSRVRDWLGSRLHPITNVVCDYLLCDYVSGEARNADTLENAAVRWVDKSALAKLISPSEIYPPVIDALEMPHC